jgi:hypothetical protein
MTAVTQITLPSSPPESENGVITKVANVAALPKRLPAGHNLKAKSAVISQSKTQMSQNPGTATCTALYEDFRKSNIIHNYAVPTGCARKNLGNLPGGACESIYDIMTSVQTSETSLGAPFVVLSLARRMTCSPVRRDSNAVMERSRFPKSLTKLKRCSSCSLKLWRFAFLSLLGATTLVCLN